MKRIGIVYDKNKAEAKKLALETKKWLEANKHKTFVRLTADVIKKLDFIITFCGDGFILKTANKVAEHEKLPEDGMDIYKSPVIERNKVYEVPILRINFGRVGYLANIEPEETFEILGKILSGSRKTINERKTRLEVEVRDKNGDLVLRKDALNEILIERTGTRTIACTVAIHNIGKEIIENTYWGDGTIIYPKTGSTAYARGAGGPPLENERQLGLVVVVPGDIKQLPWDVQPDSAIFEILEVSGKSRLVADGNQIMRLKGGEEIIIKKSQRSNLFMEFSDTDN